MTQGGLDFAEAIDPFDDLMRMQDAEHAEELPPEPFDPPDDLLPDVLGEQPGMDDTSHPPPPAQQLLPQSVACCPSWWDRMGEVVTAEELRVGGAVIHSSRCIASFGNNRCKLEFCANCGGTTQGSHSPLLAAICCKGSSSTRQRQAQRMLQRQLWPTGAMDATVGRAQLSPPLRYRPCQGGYIIAAASGADLLRGTF